MTASLRIALAAWALPFAMAASAQVSFGGQPFGLMPHLEGDIPAAPVAVMPAVDAAAMIAEDEARYATGVKGPYRFGVNHAVDLGLDNSGVWHEMPNGDRLWRQTIACPGALTINFEFHEYVVPHGALVFVYNDLGQHLGAFMAASSPGRNTMGVTQLAGERITVEYYEPADVAGEGRLRIGQVTHGYRDVFNLAKGLGDSGPCNINVVCPEGDGWEDQIASVAIITVGGSGMCTGTLINNCAEDGTPYFLTAQHCLGGGVANWVFRFNWESPECAQNLNGPTNQTVSGAQLLVDDAGTDVALLELNSVPPAEYGVYYSGWDRSSTPATSVTGIHHPSGDIKKISHSHDPVIPGTMSGAQCWHVQEWNEGTTEPGSSGSGLWNQDKLLVGQLFGGQASCGFNFNDFYGRFDVSWPLLEPHLGSCGPQQPGFDPNGGQTGCPATPPAEVDVNSPAYTAVITADPSCCLVAWTQDCQDAYDGVPSECPVEPPAGVDTESAEYQFVIMTMPACCDVAWTEDCQDAYDEGIPLDCPATPPASVDVESELYLSIIAANPACCQVEWDETCQYTWDIGTGTLPNCIEPPDHVDTASEAYWLVISELPHCCLEEWDEVCQGLFEENGGPAPVPDLDAAVTSIVGVPELVCGMDQIAPQITIKNNGYDVITSVIIVYGIVGQDPLLDVWTGSLLYLQTANHTLPPLPIMPQEQTLVITTNAPNGLEDEVPGNDSWAYALYGSIPADTVNLHLTLDDWGSDVTWTLHSEAGTLLYSGGPYADGIGDQTITIPWCLTSGCFTFTIHDAFGDGICCGSGDGGYVIANGHNYTFAENDGQYGSISIDQICIDEVGVPEGPAAGWIGVHPNPTSGSVTVALHGVPGSATLRLLDATGRLVEQRTVPAHGDPVALDMAGLGNGMYLLVAEHEGGRLVQRVVLQR